MHLHQFLDALAHAHRLGAPSVLISTLRSAIDLHRVSMAAGAPSSLLGEILATFEVWKRLRGEDRGEVDP